MRGHTEEQSIDPDEVHRKLEPGYKRAQQAYQLIVGNPDNVFAKLKAILSVLRPGAVVVFNVQGPVSNQDRQTSMRLTAREIIPRLREHASKIGLVDALERKPGQNKLRAGVKHDPVSDRGPLKELGLA